MLEASLVKLPYYECHWTSNDDQSTLVQVMAWCRQAPSHYLSQWWPRSLLPYGVTRPQWVDKHFFVKLLSGECHRTPLIQVMAVLVPSGNTLPVEPIAIQCQRKMATVLQTFSNTFAYMSSLVQLMTFRLFHTEPQNQCWIIVNWIQRN